MLRRFAFLFAGSVGLFSFTAFADVAPTGHVLVELAEPTAPVGVKSPWPEHTKVTETYNEDVFGLFELPQKYIATGVRADRAFPIVLRASAEVRLPAGKHRLLLRSRGTARLLIDGKKILETPFEQPEAFAVGNAGELPVEPQETYLNLGPDFRFATPGNREVWCEFEFSGVPATVVIETVVGGIEPKSKRPFRPELGETVVAYSPAGSTAWWLLSPGTRTVRYNDAGWAAYEAERRQHFDVVNTQARAALLTAAAPYWDKRRAAAKAWLAATPEVAVPALPKGFPSTTPIDHFIADRIAKVSAEYAPLKKGGVDFYRDVKPILEANCYSCHQGGKVKGGLRLDSLEHALLGGKADGPSIVAGNPEDSPMMQRITSTDSEEVMPAKGDPLGAKDIEIIKTWIKEGAAWPTFPFTSFELTPLADDLTFLRRVTLDTVGVVPSETEIAAFRALPAATRRAQTIDRLLADPRWADSWMGYWLDVLAENPNLINPTLNNTGPFRWWIYEALLDNKPLDLFVTELIRQQGSERFGGPAGFSIASQNDVPMAAKGIIISSAFLGVEMKCARCHDAPTHVSKQKELFQLAAMLGEKPIKLPVTSSVSMDHLRLGGREPLIEVTLAPGTTVAPAWSFEQFCDEATVASIAENPDDSRDRLAALVTAPQNERFAQVMANRIWQRFMGRGLVETIGDWEKSAPSHPELLHWLGRELVRSGYDTKALTRIILNSQAYQRAADVTIMETGPLFVAPAPRRMAAEQLVDSLFAATGKPFEVEAVNLDVDSVRTIENALDLGRASRAWMLASTSNERDRPSLTLPRIQAVAEVMEVFGWRGARPDAGSGIREVGANVLQPALLSNGTMMTWLTRLSDDHGITRLALEQQPLDALVDRLFLRMFTRLPSAAERQRYVTLLQKGYSARIVKEPTATAPTASRVRPKYVAWSNHMKSEANTWRLAEAAAARRGDPTTLRLDPDWRRRLEDATWALLNAPEWTNIL
jgi:mono/diheme cytochrome c family protein